MQWFKFYGQDFLTDPKIRSLSVEMRQCWVVLLCMASGEDKGGKLRFVQEEDILNASGIEFDGQTWHEAKGFLRLFEELEMLTIDKENSDGTFNITLNNFQKRQGEAKTPYQRVKEYRQRQKANDNAFLLSNSFKKLQTLSNNQSNDNDDNEYDNGRIEENRIDKRNNKENYSSKNCLTDSLCEEIAEQYKVLPSGVLRVRDDLLLWLEANGRTKKNYRATLQTWVRNRIEEKKLVVRKEMASVLTEDLPEISEEQRLANLQKIAEMKSNLLGGEK